MYFLVYSHQRLNISEDLASTKYSPKMDILKKKGLEAIFIFVPYIISKAFRYSFIKTEVYFGI